MPPFSQFTIKAQEGLKKAHELAIERGSSQIDAMHLLAALSFQEEGIVSAIFDKLEIDHNHITGKIRGLLCGLCNKGLGLFRDNSGLLERAMNYLIKNV